ncbi:MAG: ECF transporter S component [Clostridiales bacterium]|nr:ECF transporter S component [Clostridiales bacterium]
MKNYKTKQLVLMGLFCAIAFVAVCVFRIPVVQWLKYEPKDSIIVMAGFLFGPMAVAAISIVVSVLEFMTISDTGVWGLLMNVVSTCSFAFTAAIIYKKHRSQKGAYAGLFMGYFLMVVMMILWNYIVTPFYMGVPRGEVAKMLIPVFLPFNAVKGALNVALTLIMYKPVMRALRRAHLIPEREGGKTGSAIWNRSTILVSVVLLAASVLVILLVRGVS